MGRNIKSKHDFEHFVYVQSNKHSNWININNGLDHFSVIH